MTPRSFLPIVALGVVLSGCCHHGNVSANHPAATNLQANRYELASRHSDPLANYGAGTSADIPDNPAVGRYPGSIELPVSPLMGIGD